MHANCASRYVLLQRRMLLWNASYTQISQKPSLPIPSFSVVNSFAHFSAKHNNTKFLNDWATNGLRAKPDFALCDCKRSFGRTLCCNSPEAWVIAHDDVIKWKHFPRYCPFVRGIHPSPVNSPHKGQWRGALMLSLICARINGWVNNREAGDLRRHQAHCDVIVMRYSTFQDSFTRPTRWCVL